MTGIFAAAGISVSLIIIANGGGFSGPTPSFTNPPTNADLWRPGEKIIQGQTFTYYVTSIGPHSSLYNSKVSIDFVQDVGDNWKVNISVQNNTVLRESSVLLSKQQLTLKGQAQESFRLFFEPIESSILAIRDIAREPKYLVPGAQWDTIIVGPSSVPIKVTARERLETKAGVFDSFILSYTINLKTSKIWLTHDEPLPLRAEVYDDEGQIQYKYEITNITK